MINEIYSQQLKRRVMARIYAIYVLRQTTSPFCLKTITLGVAVTSGLFWLSLDHIFINMFSTVDGLTPLLNFSWSAFLNTELPVQFIVVLSSGIILWLAWDILSVVTVVVHKPLRLFRQSAV
ncbi:MAG: hypothetical protein A3D52_01130 [Candidatus Taylorbacteria bacterium RIFCSPHIGHO2_02_FULL_44_36]|nr:MAG: hypothetical protein A3D52_01130 [Candidatus Taylorbacteria bacterium RIFCSPHIGHO2_02_FULL_44_36]